MLKNGRTHGKMDRRTKAWKDGRTNAWKDGWTDKRIERWMDRWLFLFKGVVLIIVIHDLFKRVHLFSATFLRQR